MIWNCGASSARRMETSPGKYWSKAPVVRKHLMKTRKPWMKNSTEKITLISPPRRQDAKKNANVLTAGGNYFYSFLKKLCLGTLEKHLMIFFKNIHFNTKPSLASWRL